MRKNEEKYLSRRILAGIIDYSIVFVFIGVQFYYFGKENADGSYSLDGLPAFFVLIFWITYTIIIEQIFGATLGNLLNGIMPSSIIEKDSTLKKIRLSQSIKRHLLDPIDLGLFGLIGLIAISNTERGQRLGDLWAKTKIIKCKN